MVTNRHWLPRLRPTKGRRGTHFYRKAGERAITTYETSLQEALTYDTVTLLDTLQTYRERLDPLADLNSVEVLVENVPSVFDTGWMECSSPRQEWWIEGQYHQTRCGKTTCVECSVLDARGIATDIAQSAPSHHLGISQV